MQICDDVLSFLFRCKRIDAAVIGFEPAAPGLLVKLPWCLAARGGRWWRMNWFTHLWHHHFELISLFQTTWLLKRHYFAAWRACKRVRVLSHRSRLGKPHINPRETDGMRFTSLQRHSFGTSCIHVVGPFGPASVFCRIVGCSPNGRNSHSSRPCVYKEFK